MRSSFLEFNIATTGLFAAQTALNVTSNNIANVNTRGYSRQVVEQKAMKPMASGNGKGMLGTGTEVVNIDQLRDLYLDSKYWNQNSKLGDSEIKNTTFTKMQMLFNEPSDIGVNAIVNDFFSSLQNLSKDTSQDSYYTAVREKAKSFTSFFNETSTALLNYQKELNDEVKIKVNHINSLAAQIKSLNEQIYKFESDGSKANDLRDKRAVLVDDISKIVNVDVEENELNKSIKDTAYSDDTKGKSDKHFVVKINGQTLVDHYDLNKLVVDDRDSLSNPEDIQGIYNVKWESGLSLNMKNISGELKGYFDLRDGNNASVFNGQVSAVNVPLNQITLSGVNRGDIPDSGSLKIGLLDKEYTSFTYNEATKTATFNLVDATGINVADTVKMGTEVDFKGIPYYINKLNDFVRTFAKAFNEGTYDNGTKIDGVAGNKNGYASDGTTGNYMFGYKVGNTITGKGTFASYDKMTASNFSISNEVSIDPKKIAKSTKIGVKESENDIVNQFLSIKDNTHLFSEGKPLDFIASTIGEMAVDANFSSNYQEIQENIINTIDNQRMSEAGVNMNEEMNNLVKFQAAYSASARLITVIDEIYDKTINGMGAN